jgi:hypothetical protein
MRSFRTNAAEQWKDWMQTRALTPELAAALRSLAEVQLQMQASRSATLDARAIGVIGVDAAVTTFIFGAGLGLQARIAALAMLGLSAGLAGRSVFLGGSDEIGPSVLGLLASSDTDDRVLEESLLDSLAADVDANHRALAHKASRLTAAFVVLALAITIALVGGVN